jgi:hypothetical protein
VALYGCETWPLTLREEHRLRVFENRVLGRIFWPKRCLTTCPTSLSHFIDVSLHIKHSCLISFMSLPVQHSCLISLMSHCLSNIPLSSPQCLTVCLIFIFHFPKASLLVQYSSLIRSVCHYILIITQTAFTLQTFLCVTTVCMFRTLCSYFALSFVTSLKSGDLSAQIFPFSPCVLSDY